MGAREIDSVLAKWDLILSENDRIMAGIKKPERLLDTVHNTDETGYRNDAGFPAPERGRRGW